MLAGFVSAATGFPFRSRGGTGTVPLNSVAAIDPGSGEVVAQTPVGVDPRAVAVGDAGVWVANTTDRTVSRLDPVTGELEETVAVGVYPSDLAVGSRTVYVPSGPTGQLVRIDPSTNKATAPAPAGPDCGGVREGIALGWGSLWLACDQNAAVTRMEPRGGFVPIPQLADLLAAPTADLKPHFSAIASGAGQTWFADRARARLLGIERDMAPRAIGVGTDPWAIALGFGSVWVANRGDGTVSRVEPVISGPAARVQTIQVGERPVDIAAGEGAVWVANAGSGTVSRIDPATNRVTETIDLHNSPAGVATGGGRVWVTTAEDD